MEPVVNTELKVGEVGEPKELREVMEPRELGGLSPGLSQSRGAGRGVKTTRARGCGNSYIT